MSQYNKIQGQEIQGLEESVQTHAEERPNAASAVAKDGFVDRNPTPNRCSVGSYL